jgi:hypothetical protein
MPAFQKEVWEGRAWERYRKKTERDPSTAPQARHRLDVDINAISGLDAVIMWCARRGIKVEFSNQRDAGVFSSEEKTIYVNSAQNYENQLFVLLHESGHLLIGSEKADAHHRFKLGYPSSSDPALKGKFIHRCAILEEEFEAWHRGRKLAKKLELDLDETRWSALKAKFLKSYIRWSLKDPDFEDHP